MYIDWVYVKDTYSKPYNHLVDIIQQQMPDYTGNTIVTREKLVTPEFIMMDVEVIFPGLFSDIVHRKLDQLVTDRRMAFVIEISCARGRFVNILLTI